MTTPALIIAGSEATGGAGIQADIKTFQRLGVFATGTLTCIVAFDPNDNWNHRVTAIDPQVIADQIEAATAAHDLDTVKIGMLGTPATIDTVADSLSQQEWRHIVLDPVLICKGQEPGAALDTDTALREKILPMATVITPNMFETRTLSGREELNTIDDLKEAARIIADQGPKCVVVKGGVEFPGDEAVDVLWDGEEFTVHSVPKIGNERVAGAGCSLAAAIGAELAKGAEINSAVAVAKALVTAGIEHRLPGNTPFDTLWQGAPLA